ncbi:MAG: helix-turn-helix transcriptional regulator [Clostridia bacterium]|nr:helix-turn-helix transcriptional regulator [Clostridia bacterium]
MTLGQRIQQIRIEHSLSQEEFAERLGTTRQTVSRWELDQTYPEIAKIVLISKVFSVSTDSILKDGISTFDTSVEHFNCGVYRGANCEIVETEKFALMLYCSSDKNILGAKLYRGFENKKRLVAICERDLFEKKTEYAYFVEDSHPYTAISNSERLTPLLSAAYDPHVKSSTRRSESFAVDHSGAPLPTVKDAGIKKCLTSWRMVDSYFAKHDHFNFFLYTGKTEYIFSIQPKDVNIYCGASYNMVFDLGLFGGGQFFRIRNYKDNSEKWCRFTCDFSYEAREINIPTQQCELGKCIETDKGLMWCVKRYTDDEIVLQGCGDGEYIYRRTDKRNERFVGVDGL